MADNQLQQPNLSFDQSAILTRIAELNRRAEEAKRQAEGLLVPQERERTAKDVLQSALVAGLPLLIGGLTKGSRGVQAASSGSLLGLQNLQQSRAEDQERENKLRALEAKRQFDLAQNLTGEIAGEKKILHEQYRDARDFDQSKELKRFDKDIALSRVREEAGLRRDLELEKFDREAQPEYLRRTLNLPADVRIESNRVPTKAEAADFKASLKPITSVARMLRRLEELWQKYGTSEISDTKVQAEMTSIRDRMVSEENKIRELGALQGFELELIKSGIPAVGRGPFKFDGTIAGQFKAAYDDLQQRFAREEENAGLRVRGDTYKLIYGVPEFVEIESEDGRKIKIPGAVAKQMQR